MPSQHTDARRRIATAKARLDTWTDHQRSLELDPAHLEALAGTIEEAGEALWALERPGRERTGQERRLRRALEDLRVAMETLGRQAARRPPAEPRASIRTVAGLRVAVRHWRGALGWRPVITGIEVDPVGRIHLTFCCPGLDHDPDLCVRVRRRVGKTGTYEPIGMAMGNTYIDAKPHRTGRVAAYKIELASGPLAGAWSRRAHVDMSRRPLPGGWASRHIGHVESGARPPLPQVSIEAA